MSKIILGGNQYGKAETRVVRIYRDTPRHEIHDVNVTTCLRGDFSAAHFFLQLSIGRGARGYGQQK